MAEFYFQVGLPYDFKRDYYPAYIHTKILKSKKLFILDTS